MTRSSPAQSPLLASTHAALQHRPRPLPLFLHMLRSEAGDDPERMAAVLAGVRAYQDATRPRPMRRARRIARVGRATLRDYGGDGPSVVFVPSLINGPEILDLDRERSLLRWLRTQGVRPLMVDWGTPTPQESSLDFAGHVERLLVPLIGRLAEPPVLAGYCLGGTMALAAATLLPLRGLALIAAPWRFSGFPDGTRGPLEELWSSTAPMAERIGLMPMEVLQSAFWRIDPVRTLAKFEKISRRLDDHRAIRAFATVEDWANNGAPMTHAAARDLIERFFLRDEPGSGTWAVGARAVDPLSVSCPVMEVVSATDRIVPAASAAGIGRRLDLTLGHVGMVVGGQARSALWEPLADWMRSL